MSHTASGYRRKEKWYNKNIFPLVPVFEHRKPEEHNTRNFSFRWLIFTFWTLDHFEFEIAFTTSTHWGIGITFILPYLRGVIAIPCPEKIGIWVSKKLRRKCITEKKR